MCFLNNKTESNDGSRVMNLLIQACKRKDYDCKKVNHGVKMISKKRLEKTNNGLVVKINQMQTHYSGKKKDYKSMKTNNVAERFQEQKLGPYTEFVNKNTQQKKSSHL